MFKLIVVILIVVAFAPLQITDSSPNTDYWRNFVIAKNSFEEDLGAIPSILIGNAYYGAYSAPQEALEIRTLAYMMTEKPVKTSGNALRGQCVYYISEIKKLPIPKGNANQIKPNSKIPVIGGAVLFWGGKYGHIAFVENMTDTTLYLSEMNLVGLGVISTRSIELTDPRIKGFLK